MFARDKDKVEKQDAAKGECCGGKCDCSAEGSAEGPAAATELQQLKQQMEELNSKYLRTVADYQNVARRSVKEAGEAEYQGMKSVIQSVVPVLDHFDLALSQDVKKASAEQIVDGVKVIRDELMKVLQSHGVEVIAPAANAEFDPNLHQAVTHQNAPNVGPGRIVATLQTGYKLDDRLIRPAMVAVRPAAGA